MTITVTTLTQPSLAVYKEAGGSHINTTVDADSNSGQKVLNIASTTGMEVGMILQIDPTSAGGGYEEGTIASISAGVSVTLEENLTNTHTAVQADEVTIKWYYVLQTSPASTIYSCNTLNRLSKFSEEQSVTMDSTNRQNLIFMDPTEDTNAVGIYLGRTWESGNYSIRDTQCWFYGGTGSLQQYLRASVANTTVNVDSASGGTVLNVASTTGFAANEYIIIGMGTAREEVSRISSVGSGLLNLDRNLSFTHTAAQADTVFEAIGEDDFNAT